MMLIRAVFASLVAAVLSFATAGCTPQSSARPAVSLPPGYVVPASVNARATEWFGYCMSGNWDWTQFGSGPNDSPTDPTVRSTFESTMKNLLAPYGQPRSMELFGLKSFRMNEGHNRTAYYYYVNLDHGAVDYTFSLDSDDRIGGVLVKTLGANSITEYFDR